MDVPDPRPRPPGVPVVEGAVVIVYPHFCTVPVRIRVHERAGHFFVWEDRRIEQRLPLCLVPPQASRASPRFASLRVLHVSWGLFRWTVVERALWFSRLFSSRRRACL